MKDKALLVRQLRKCPRPVVRPKNSGVLCVEHLCIETSDTRGKTPHYYQWQTRQCVISAFRFSLLTTLVRIFLSFSLSLPISFTQGHSAAVDLAYHLRIFMLPNQDLSAAEEVLLRPRSKLHNSKYKKYSSRHTATQTPILDEVRLATMTRLGGMTVAAPCLGDALG